MTTGKIPDDAGPDELRVIISWQDDRLIQLDRELHAARAKLREVATLALYVISDTTPAGMASDEEQRLRDVCSRIVGAQG